MKLILPLLVILLLAGSVSAATYYVRTDGNNACDGLVDAPGSSGACAWATPQYAHDTASCADTVYLKSNQTWTTAGQYLTVLTVTKVCTAGNEMVFKSTLADTISASRPATLEPDGGTLAKYAHMIAVGGSGGGYGPIIVDAAARYIIFDGIHLTTQGSGNNSANSLLSTDGNHITVRRSYFHPPETSQVDWERSTQRAVALGGEDFLFEYNRAGPFLGYDPGSGTPGNIMLSEVIQCVQCQRVTVRDNYLDAFYANVFLGGGDTSPGHTTTTSAVDGTAGATLASTTHLAAGIVVRVSISGTGTLVGDTLTHTAGDTITSDAIGDGITLVNTVGGATYYNGVVQTVSGDDYGITTPQDPPNGTYTYTVFQTAIVTAVDSGTGEVDWTPYGVNALSQAPAVGAGIAWADGDEGLNNDFLVQRNVVSVNYAFAEYHVSHGGSGPKGYWEVKNCNRMTVEGNVFLGFPSSPVWFGTNQAGTAPWITTKNIIVRNNFFFPDTYGSNGPYMTFVVLQGDTYTSTPGSNVAIYNNLALNQGMTMRLSDGSDVSIYHNTVLPFGGVDYNTSVAAINVTNGVTVNDNIAAFRTGALKCLIDGNLATCWPTRTILKNVFVDEEAQGINTSWYGAGSILAPIIEDFADVGFENYAQCQAGTIAACALAVSSDYKGDGTGGSDPGCDIPALIAALGNTQAQLRISGKVTIQGSVRF